MTSFCVKRVISVVVTLRKNMKFCTTFAGTKDVWVVAHDFGLADVHLLQNLLPLNHTYFIGCMFGCYSRVGRLARQSKVPLFPSNKLSLRCYHCSNLCIGLQRQSALQKHWHADIRRCCTNHCHIWPAYVRSLSRRQWSAPPSVFSDAFALCHNSKFRYVCIITCTWLLLPYICHYRGICHYGE